MDPALIQIEAPASPTPLVGIARLAAQGESLRQGHLIEYFTLPARSLLNRCTSARVPFAWTINPYRGCEFACKYCYARYTHEFMEMREGVDFERKIYVKQQAAWLLRRDLKKVKPGSRSPSAPRPILISRRKSASRLRAAFWKSWRCTRVWRLA
jgi:hypothetical protein